MASFRQKLFLRDRRNRSGEECGRKGLASMGSLAHPLQLTQKVGDGQAEKFIPSLVEAGPVPVILMWLSVLILEGKGRKGLLLSFRLGGFKR